MADSRRSAKPADPLRAALERALGRREGGSRWLLAFSGGLDSTALLHAAVTLLGARALLTVHVHHGLQRAADHWPEHCVQQAAALGVACEVVRLDSRPPAGQSVEAWARIERYGALARIARRCEAAGILTAHHADDQAETLLMRIARGTGVDGLTGVALAGHWQGVPVLRPLLALPRAQLQDYARRHGLIWVDDPSNQQMRWLRNALRQRVLPVVDEVAPAFRANLLRLAAGLDDAREAVAALALIDLQAAQKGPATRALPDGYGLLEPASNPPLDAAVLAASSPARRAAALRLWLAHLGLPMPSQAKLREIERQLVSGQGAYGSVLHHGMLLRRYRQRIDALPADQWAAAAEVSLGRADSPARPLQLRWFGEASLVLPGYAGRLHFDPVESDADVGADRVTAPGVNACWLSARPIEIGAVGSAGRLRLAPAGRSRSLKNLYQERAVPAWERLRLPVVVVDGHLLYAAGIGMDRDRRWPNTPPSIALRWESARV